MTAIRDFDTLRKRLTQSDPVSVVVAGSASAPVVASLAEESRRGLVDRVVLLGDRDKLERLLHEVGAHENVFETEPCAADPAELAARAVAAIRDGRGSVLAKGGIDSAVLIRALLDRETGLRAGALVSNLTVFSGARYHKLLGVTDNGIVPAPNAEQKVSFIMNALPVFEALGVAPVKVALVGASEKVLDSLPATGDAVSVREHFAQAVPAGRCIVEGPFGYDVCISREAAEHKGVRASEVAGDPDLLVFHDIEAANAVGKAIKFHGAAASGGLLLGCSVPVMFNSRSDGPERRSNSLLLAAAMAGAMR